MPCWSLDHRHEVSWASEEVVVTQLLQRWMVLSNEASPLGFFFRKVV